MHQGGAASRRGGAALSRRLAGGVGAALAGAAAAGWVLRRRHRLGFAGRVALVTGGSRGLGLAIAGELVHRGARVAIVARDRDELAAAARRLRDRGSEVLPIEADLADPDQARGVVARTVRRFRRLDVLVHNAGVITVGPLETMRLADFEESMQVHFWAALHLAIEALPELLRAGGRIVNVASIGGRVPVPHLAAYSASKAALVGLSDSLRAELAPRGVAVTTVCPGLMRTGSHLHARFRGDRRREATWFTAAALAPGISMDADRAARRIVDACRDGRPYLTFNLPATLAIHFEGAAPGLARRAAGVVARALPRSAGDDGPALAGHQLGPLPLPPFLRRRGERVARRHLETVALEPGGQLE